MRLIFLALVVFALILVVGVGLSNGAVPSPQHSAVAIP